MRTDDEIREDWPFVPGPTCHPGIEPLQSKGQRLILEVLLDIRRAVCPEPALGNWNDFGYQCPGCGKNEKYHGAGPGTIAVDDSGINFCTECDEALVDHSRKKKPYVKPEIKSEPRRRT
uniref:Uncharacterized protein n=1 Tax=viral metagenome TaxID=1070528 RepID=A0A6M3KVS2_9ZZZZ